MLLIPPDELTGGDSHYLLEEAGEMMRKLETEYTRSLTDITSLHQQTLAEINDIGVDIVDGGGACRLTEHITKIVGRIRHLRGAVGYCRQS